MKNRLRIDEKKKKECGKLGHPECARENDLCVYTGSNDRDDYADDERIGVYKIA